MTLNVLVRYFVPEYHDAFVYLVEGMDYVVVVFLIQMLTLYFEGSVVAVTKVFPGLNTAFECSLTLS